MFDGCFLNAGSVAWEEGGGGDGVHSLGVGMEGECRWIGSYNLRFGRFLGVSNCTQCWYILIAFNAAEMGIATPANAFKVVNLPVQCSKSNASFMFSSSRPEFPQPLL